jgi:biopolymer transport protein ExbD
MRKLLKSKPADDANIDITPLIDIVFIMLIFFIVTATFVKETGLDVSMPDAPTNPTPEKSNILIRIDANDNIWIDLRRVDPRAVRPNIERLHAENPEGSVVIQADPESTNELLVIVMDASRQAGVYNIALASPQ